MYHSLIKILALIAATLAIPVFAYVYQGIKNKGDNGQPRLVERNEHQWDNHDGDRGSKAPVVPEANLGWVLTPFFGVVLLYSARQLRVKTELRPISFEAKSRNL